MTAFSPSRSFRRHVRPGSAWVLFGPVLILAPCVGCGGKHRLEVAPVTGRVVYQGQGVPQAVVIFHPADEADQRAKKMRPFAYADESGNFQLKTYVDGDGAPLGMYRVSIVAMSSSPGSKPGKDSAPSDVGAPSTPGIRIPPQVTKKYANVDTSGIQVTIHEGENNLEPFKL